MKPIKYKIPQVALRCVRERTLSLPCERLLTPDDAAAVARSVIGDRPNEMLIAIALDGRARITSIATISVGGMHGASVRLADVLRLVLVAKASAFILAHNHPSGDPTPSEQDIDFTERLRKAAETVDLVLVDHVIIIGEGESYERVP